jgi:lia operon protein LiaG
MKTSAMIRIILYAFIALLLTGVLIWGIGGNHNLNFFSFNLFGNSGLNYNDDEYIIGDGEVDKDKVDSIQVDWLAGNVTVLPYEEGSGDNDVVTFTEESNTQLDEDYEMRYKVEGGVLKIMFAKSKVKFSGIFKSLNKDLTIQLPEGMTLNDVTIDTVSANIEIENVEAANQFDLETVSGTIDGYQMTGGMIDAETVSGEIRWSDGSFQSVDAESVSGAINVSFATMPSDIKVETVSGSMTLSLPENEGFKVDYDKVSGNFDCEFDVKINKNMAMYKNGVNKIKMDTVSGDMKILAN